MKVVEGSFVKIDFGIEHDLKVKVGPIYQDMEGIVESLGDRYDSEPRIILIEEYRKKIEEYNLRTGNSWRIDPRIPIEFLVRLSKKTILKNE